MPRVMPVLYKKTQQHRPMPIMQCKHISIYVHRHRNSSPSALPISTFSQPRPLSHLTPTLILHNNSNDNTNIIHLPPSIILPRIMPLHLPRKRPVSSTIQTRALRFANDMRCKFCLQNRIMFNPISIISCQTV